METETQLLNGSSESAEIVCSPADRFPDEFAAQLLRMFDTEDSNGLKNFLENQPELHAAEEKPISPIAMLFGELQSLAIDQGEILDFQLVSKIVKTVIGAILLDPHTQKTASTLITFLKKLRMLTRQIRRKPPSAGGGGDVETELSATALKDDVCLNLIYFSYEAENHELLRKQFEGYLFQLEDDSFFNMIRLCELEIGPESAVPYFQHFIDKKKFKLAMNVANHWSLLLHDDTRKMITESVLHSLLSGLPIADACILADRVLELRPRLIDILSEEPKNHKTAVKLIKRWKCDPERFPTVLSAISERSANYLVNLSSIDPDIILELAEGYPELQAGISSMFYRRKNFDAADVAYLAVKASGNLAALKMIPPKILIRLEQKYPPSELPPPMHLFAQQKYGTSGGRPKNANCLSIETFTGRRPFNQAVKLVDTIDKLDEMLRILLHCEYVGIDAEWRPPLSPFWVCSAAILQIAPNFLSSEDLPNVYIVDLIACENKFGTAADEMLGAFFREEKPYKVGLAFHQEDWARLQLRGEQHYDNLRGCVDLQRVVLDVPAFAKYVLSKQLSEPPRRRKSRNNKDDTEGKTRRGMSLSEIAERVMGLPLDKHCQMVNWEKRPLTKERQSYAAMDAVVVCAAVEKLMRDNAIRCFSEVVSQYPSLIITKSDQSFGGQQKLMKDIVRPNLVVNKENKSTVSESAPTESSASLQLITEQSSTVTDAQCLSCA